MQAAVPYMVPLSGTLPGGRIRRSLPTAGMRRLAGSPCAAIGRPAGSSGRFKPVSPYRPCGQDGFQGPQHQKEEQGIAGAGDGAQSTVARRGLAGGHQGGCQTAADGGRELLDRIEYGVPVRLLVIGQSTEAVGHDVAEAQPDAQHEEDVEAQYQRHGQVAAAEGEPEQAAQGDQAPADDRDDGSELVIQPA